MDNNVFPLPFYVHLVFVSLAFLLFIFQFARYKKTYQILMACAIPATLLLYINPSRTWYYLIGVLEVVLILLALVATIADKVKNRALKKAEEAEAPAEESAAE